MTVLSNCTVHYALFVTSVVCVILGNVAARYALNGRVVKRSWTVRLAYPVYLLKNDLFRGSGPISRYAALALLATGLACLILTAAPVLQASVRGDAVFCGVNF